MENDTSIFYFAYGSNMDYNQMLERCPNSKFAGTAVLRDHKIGFTRKSNKWNSGVADILVSPGDEVWGVLYSVSNEDLLLLDKFEGVSIRGYKRIVLAVEKRITKIEHLENDEDIKNHDFENEDTLNFNIFFDSSYKQINAYTYEVVEKNLNLNPTTEYLNKILDAAFENNFPAKYISLLSNFGKKDVEYKTDKAIDFLLHLRDIVINNNWPSEVQNEPEWGGAGLVITGDEGRKRYLAMHHPNDLVIVTPNWKNLSWLLRNIYHHPTMNWQITSENKYDILSQLGKAMIAYLENNPSESKDIGIYESLISSAYQLLTH